MEMAYADESSRPVSTPPIKLLLTVSEAAAALSICRAVVYELLLSGNLASVKIGRARRIPVAVLEDFIARQLHDGQQDPSEGEAHGATRA